MARSGSPAPSKSPDAVWGLTPLGVREMGTHFPGRSGRWGWFFSANGKVFFSPSLCLCVLIVESD